ncbi:MAG TPA: cardiolipin synthase [Pirellulales bacterium]|nr:cardiolipin synthase [Pirellulales bacterium]
MDHFLRGAQVVLHDFWQYVFTGGMLIATIVASCHAALTKRNVRGAIGWVGIIWLVPIVGVALYALLGINRIKRRGTLLRSGQYRAEPRALEREVPAEQLEKTLTAHNHHMRTLVELVGRVTHRPLLAGNRIETLAGGDAAYPAMLAAIDAATQSVSLMSYIFDNDRLGQRFVDALKGAVERGVEVRVLVDAIGSRYSFPSIIGKLVRAGIRAERFLESLLPGYFAYANLRNHRKIMVVDGRIGFTGGLNIRAAEMLSLHTRSPIQDLHFRLTGPVVLQLQEVFAEDWSFATKEVLSGEQWFPPAKEAGTALARGIRSGPDEDLGEISLVLAGALSCAHSSVALLTPYFLPDETLMSALNVAAMRGVQVDIILPSKNNLALVQWASTASLPELLEHGCRVWLSPPPFDHTKLLLVDNLWSLVGSSNWDPRSLRLNFEFNVECYDRDLAKSLGEMVAHKRSVARQLSPVDINGRALPLRLRDGIARLLSPYL